MIQNYYRKERRPEIDMPDQSRKEVKKWI
jgi:hypothetical protein